MIVNNSYTAGFTCVFSTIYNQHTFSYNLNIINMNQLKDILIDLKQTGLIKITGSYAAGKQNESSDLDFYVTPDRRYVDCK